MNNTPDYTTKETAEIFKCASSTISEYCKNGRFPGAYQTGLVRGQWRIPPESIEAFKEASRPPVCTDPNRIPPRSARSRAALKAAARKRTSK